MLSDLKIADLADHLASLYETEFGGKPRGRFRISRKALSQLAGCRRIYPETCVALQRSLFERELILIDLDSFFVVLSARIFATYRRVGPAMVNRFGSSMFDSEGHEFGSEDE